MKRLVVVFCLSLLSAPAFGQTGRSLGTTGPDLEAERAPSDTRHSGDADERGERLVCRTSQAQSYSRMGSHRVCHTQGEWRAIDRQAGSD
jgi:hypothetical protein